MPNSHHPSWKSRLPSVNSDGDTLVPLTVNGTKLYTSGATVSMVLIGKSIALFVLAGLCEIGGGYLVWQWWRNGSPGYYGGVGAAVLFLYGLVPTYQPAHFGRVYAAYGGVFVVLSLLWDWGMDRVAPDRYDLLGGMICLVGVSIIMYWPR
jgi:small multidrug resistance family-3 protein